MSRVLTSIILALALTSNLAASETEAVKGFDRGVGKMNSVFIPKGYVGGGVTFSYKTLDMGNSTHDVG